MSTINSQVRRFQTCPRMAASFSGSIAEQSAPRGGERRPADFASAVRSGTSGNEVVANGLPTAKGSAFLRPVAGPSPGGSRIRPPRDRAPEELPTPLGSARPLQAELKGLQSAEAKGTL